MGVFDCISSSSDSSTSMNDSLNNQDPVVVGNAYALLKDLVHLFNQMDSPTQV